MDILNDYEGLIHHFACKFPCEYREDLKQEGRLYVWLHRDHLWEFGIYTAMVNYVRKVLGDSRRNKPVFVEFDEMPVYDNHEDDILKALSNHERELIELKYLYEYSYKEIGEICGFSHTTAFYRINGIVNKLGGKDVLSIESRDTESVLSENLYYLPGRGRIQL